MKKLRLIVTLIILTLVISVNLLAQKDVSAAGDERKPETQALPASLKERINAYWKYVNNENWEKLTN
jgi:hypothetical protein